MEVLEDFPYAVAGLKLSHLLELIPPLQPRAFSIASSMAVRVVFPLCLPHTPSCLRPILAASKS